MGWMDGLRAPSVLITERGIGEMYCRRKMPPEKKTEKKDEEKEKSSVPWVRQLFHLNALSSFWRGS